jgi:exodeoxyribonuclease VII large subunit
VTALENLNSKTKLDVILIARGGGSIEDLWAFNDERVVRAVAASKIPVISGVGHETDFTLTDFAADLRAPTPTAAAELATAITVEDLKYSVGQLQMNLSDSIHSSLESRRVELDNTDLRLKQFSPIRRLQSDRQRVDELSHLVDTAIRHKLDLSNLRIQALNQRLVALSPLEVLKRGYAVVNRSKDSKLVDSVKKVRQGDELRVRVSDGSFNVNVTKKADG